jgi:hypothetical protein
MGAARLATGTGPAITVCHFPAGTSAWNKIEHRLFSSMETGSQASRVAMRVRGSLVLDPMMDMLVCSTPQTCAGSQGSRCDQCMPTQ